MRFFVRCHSKREYGSGWILKVVASNTRSSLRAIKFRDSRQIFLRKQKYNIRPENINLGTNPICLNLGAYTQGSQSTEMAPQVELPQSWMNFSMEKTPVRSSTLRPYSAWRPLSWLSANGSLEIHPMWATPITLLFRLASRTPVQQAGQLPSFPLGGEVSTFRGYV